ncbi:rod shape-determining protein RodA [Clostridium fallax]|uniref:Rod shape determining protein RodA n=1 Tax=Clostridium fallax TaxID=1533 RepID=A0A1M4VAJ8_9CLOT|nr:rod shape-determining protein RodA [Clostridium fallax]SHE66011.1 rod shape determining protein RodA [Clostridium fallax]SQB05810.1 FtsW/RodA/SpoVE family cell cycle protein [Clostridium fallax]
MLNKLKIDTKLLKELDLSILISMIMIVLFGIVNIYVATRASKGMEFSEKQFVWLILSLFVMYFLLVIDYSTIMAYVPIFYWICIGLLIFTKFKGATINGAQGWIRYGAFSLQPAELAKMGMILMLAKKLNDMDGEINNIKNFCILAFYAIVPMMFIVSQPDMGMTMVCFFIALGIFFCAGLDWRVIVGGLASIMVAIVIVWNSGLIHDYQKGRIKAVFNPEADELGSNLQLNQSMIGIGSGGFFGTGLNMNKDSVGGYSSTFVPENQTDFIFSIIGEHFGTIGAIFLLVIYGIMIYRFLLISREAKDIFGSIICIGMAAYFLFAILQNIGMTIGIMPITGITLPLVSYGGSSLMTTVLSIGLVLNVGMRRKKINF